MLDIAKQWQGPYGILYVLLAPRLGHHAVRYEAPEPCSFDDLELFAYTFQEYFERDGRHHLWFADVPTSSQLIYDNHNIIYAYGNDDVIFLLESKGFFEGSPQIPAPHQHCYNQEFDTKEDELMQYFEWIEFPLEDQDD